MLRCDPFQLDIDESSEYIDCARLYGRIEALLEAQGLQNHRLVSRGQWWPPFNDELSDLNVEAASERLNAHLIVEELGSETISQSSNGASSTYSGDGSPIVKRSPVVTRLVARQAAEAERRNAFVRH